MQTVLVIDDDAGIREVIGVMLEKEGFRAIFAADGKTGLQEAMTARPNLIVVDLRMPGLSGVDVCKSLRQRRRANAADRAQRHRRRDRQGADARNRS